MALRQAWSVAPAAGLLWGVLAWTSSSWAMLSAALLYGLAGVAAAWVDLDAPRIPDRLLAVAAPLVAVTEWAGVAVQGQCWRVWTSLAAAGVLTLVYAAQAWFGSMGWGDVKLAAVTGLALGLHGWSAVALGTFVAVGAGGLAAAALLARGRGGKDSLAYDWWTRMPDSNIASSSPACGPLKSSWPLEVEGPL